jgi:hypothetical protein
MTLDLVLIGDAFSRNEEPLPEPDALETLSHAYPDADWVHDRSCPRSVGERRLDRDGG